MIIMLVVHQLQKQIVMNLSNSIHYDNKVFPTLTKPISYFYLSINN